MTTIQQATEEETGVTDVRRVRKEIAAKHKGDLAAHIAETNRLAAELRHRFRLGPVVKPPGGEQVTAGTTPA
jgi:hypothetical protein